MLGRTYAFAESFQTLVTFTMNKVLKTDADYRAIANKENFPDLNQTSNVREKIKSYFEKTFSYS